jgi:hypothetical protein
MVIQFLNDGARWPEPNAGWRDGMSAEAYLALDLFVSFCIKAKRKETPPKANATEAMRSVSGANRKKLVSYVSKVVA